MKPSNCADMSTLRHQTGEALLEALIGMLIMACLSLGMAFAMSRALYAQRFTSTQTQAVSAMRQVLSTQGVTSLCATGSATADGQEIAASCAINSTITVDPLQSDGSASLGVSQTVPATTILSSLATASNTTTQQRYGGDGILRIAP